MAQLLSTAPRGSSGPFVRSKTSALRVTKWGYRVLTRSQRPGPEHGRWSPISRSGWIVFCPSRLEASELVWFCGGRLHPRPADLDKGDERDEERYLDWLLQHHFRIEPYHATGRMEVSFAEFLKGWYPGSEEILKEARMAYSVVEPLLRSRWEGR